MSRALARGTQALPLPSERASRHEREPGEPPVVIIQQRVIVQVIAPTVIDLASRDVVETRRALPAPAVPASLARKVADAYQPADPTARRAIAIA